jgi:hypothetical protein
MARRYEGKVTERVGGVIGFDLMKSNARTAVDLVKSDSIVDGIYSYISGFGKDNRERLRRLRGKS